MLARRQRTLARWGEWLFSRRGPLSGVVLLGVVAATVLAARAGLAAPRTSRGFDGAGLGIVILALGCRALVVGTTAPRTSGRDRRLVAAESLNTTGAYSVVRHPLYVANFLAWIGVALLSGTWWIPTAAAVLGIALYGPIIAAEEQVLRQSFGETHRAWAARTPAVVPNPLGWRPPTRAFSWRAVLRREYPSLVVTAVAAYLVHLARVYQVGRGVPRTWTIGLAVALGLASVLRLLSHATRLFEGPADGPPRPTV